MAEIRHRESTWSVWTHGCPNGEQVDQVQRRSEQTIDRMLMIPKPGDIALFAHGHSLRDLACSWLGGRRWRATAPAGDWNDQPFGLGTVNPDSCPLECPDAKQPA